MKVDLTLRGRIRKGNMARQKKAEDKIKTGSAALGFEATLWATADKQRGGFA